MNTELIIHEWQLDPIPVEQTDAAVRALEAGDISNFFKSVNNEDCFWLLSYNFEHLYQLGLCEPAVLHAFMASHTNYHSIWNDLCVLFYSADHKRLREAGQPLPGAGPFTVYRAVAGHGRDRRVRGYWWTPSFESAQQEANQLWACHGLPKPAVYRTTVKAQDILTYIKEGQEEVFILFSWNIDWIQRVCSMDDGYWKFTAGFRDFEVQQVSLDLRSETNSKDQGEAVHDN